RRSRRASRRRPVAACRRPAGRRSPRGAVRVRVAAWRILLTDHSNGLALRRKRRDAIRPERKTPHPPFVAALLRRPLPQVWGRGGGWLNISDCLTESPCLPTSPPYLGERSRRVAAGEGSWPFLSVQCS